MEKFRGCTALVTGASSGIGAEFARQLAPWASHLVLVARRAERLESLKLDIERRFPGTQVYIYGLDVTDPDGCDAFFEWLDACGLTVDLLVNNAGLGDHGPFVEGAWPRVREMIEVNIVALTRFTHRLLPAMKAAGHGAVINVSSIAGLLPVPGISVYAATKAYVNSFSEAIRIELRGSGVTVTTVCPGPVNTEFGRVARRGEGPSMVAPEIMKVPVEQVVAEGLAAAAARRARVVPGLFVAAIMTLATAVPICILRHILRPHK
jgi:short-subunit dehydrogenase